MPLYKLGDVEQWHNSFIRCLGCEALHSMAVRGPAAAVLEVLLRLNRHNDVISYTQTRRPPDQSGLTIINISRNHLMCLSKRITLSMQTMKSVCMGTDGRLRE